MTNGLFKVARTEWVPTVPAVPPIPAEPERWWLAPPPPGYYYAFKNSTWSLKKYDPPGLGTGTGSSGGSYTWYASSSSGAFLLREGDKYSAVYKLTGQPNTVMSGTVPPGPFSLPSPGPEWTLYSVTITPANSSTPSDPPELQLSKVPSPARAIQFATSTYSNGYPVGPGPYQGTFLVPNPAGGYTEVTRSYTKTGPNGLFVPAPSVSDPAGVTTSASGVRAVLIAAFAGAPGVPAVPGYTKTLPSLGWDAGANSIAELDGDLYVRFQVPAALGARVGFFTGGERDAADRDALAAGFYVYSDATGARWSIVDNGRQVVMDDNQHVADTFYEIRRVSGQITYFVGDVLRWRSPTPLEGALRVGTTLYAPGDMVL